MIQACAPIANLPLADQGAIPLPVKSLPAKTPWRAAKALQTLPACPRIKAPGPKRADAETASVFSQPKVVAACVGGGAMPKIQHLIRLIAPFGRKLMQPSQRHADLPPCGTTKAPKSCPSQQPTDLLSCGSTRTANSRPSQRHAGLPHCGTTKAPKSLPSWRRMVLHPLSPSFARPAALWPCLGLAPIFSQALLPALGQATAV